MEKLTPCCLCELRFAAEATLEDHINTAHSDIFRVFYSHKEEQVINY